MAPTDPRVEVRALRGPAAIEPHLDALAALRIAVFRDWPYLYDGDLNYERSYLRAYAEPGALVVGVFAGGRMVGAATAAPMERHAADLAEPLRAMGRDPRDVYYLAESVLLPAWRSRGLGHRFFDEREAEGLAQGRRWAAFCAVIRPADHPARPPGGRSHDAFWRRRGYRPVPGAVARFRWRDLGASAESQKELQVWTRPLSAAAAADRP